MADWLETFQRELYFLNSFPDLHVSGSRTNGTNRKVQDDDVSYSKVLTFKFRSIFTGSGFHKFMTDVPFHLSVCGSPPSKIWRSSNAYDHEWFESCYKSSSQSFDMISTWQSHS